MTLYRLAFSLALLLSAPYWLVRMWTQKKYALGLRQRLGIVPSTLARFVQGKQIIWLHAVSVGETLAATRLVTELEQALPGYTVVVSTTTAAGQALAQQRFGAERVFYFPLDSPPAVSRYLEVLQPKLMVLMESELWPAHLELCRRRRIPVVVANTRVSDRSYRRTRHVAWLWKWMAARVTLFLAQSEEDARRLLALGATAGQVMTSGNLKYDVRAAAEMPVTTLVRQQLSRDARLLVAGSTLGGEEAALLDCLPQWPRTVLLLAPRHPERFDEVAALLEQRDIPFQRMSAWRLQPEPLMGDRVLLLDSIGELASLYSLAQVAFVGGSLFGAGGHNPLESAQWGVPVVQGLSYENFRGPVDALLAAQAIEVVPVEGLCGTLKSLLEDASRARQMGERARAVFESQAGATGRSVAAIVRVMERTR